MLPEKFQFLEKEGAPKMLVEALKLYGVKEYPGAGDNPVIMEWAKEIGVEKDYKHDATAWCGLSMGVVAKRAGKDVVKSPLWALNWSKFGIEVDEPMLADVVIFRRYKNGKLIGGHVGLYIGETKKTYFVLGGNQADSFSIMEIAKNRLAAARRPIYKIGIPPNVRKIYLDSTGVISINEA